MKSMGKKVILLTVVVLFLSGISSAYAQEKADSIKSMKCWASMDCENCKTKLEKNIAFEKGVKGLEVDFATKILTIQYRGDKTNPKKLEKAIQKLGFKTEIIEEKQK